MRARPIWRVRWAAIGAAVAVTLGGGGLFVAHAVSSPESSTVLITPTRILDTRDPTNLGLPGPFVSPVAQKLQVTGAIPTSAGVQTVVPAGATGVSLNVTVVQPSAAGFLSIRPGDATGAPQVSSLNNTAGVSLANAVTVALPRTGPDAGKIEITWDAYGAAGRTTEVLIDVVGYTTDSQLANTYTKSEVDALLAPFTNSAAAFAGGDQLVDLDSTEVVVRSVSLMPPANGMVIVNSSAHLFRISGSAGARCSITTGTSIDYGFLQMANMPDISQAAADLAGTRGFAVSKGVLLTVNLVCDEYMPNVRLQDSVLTAIFAPS